MTRGIWIMLALAGWLWAASPAAAQAPAQPVAIRFQAMVGDRPFACGETYADIGTTRARVTPSDFRFYVSDVRLVDARGEAVPVALEQDGAWQHANVALLDFENKTGPCANGTTPTRDVVVGSVPAGTYTGLRFTLGVPYALNHEDATIAPSPLNLTSMFWNWLGGYKFLRIDMATRGGAGARPGAGGFIVHLGSTACRAGEGAPVAHGAAAMPGHDAAARGGHGAGQAGMDVTQKPTACGNPNRPTIAFASFDPARNVVVADLAALLEGTDVEVNQPGTPPGCMSAPGDGDCRAVMARLGLAYDGAPAAPQAFFRVK